MSAKRRMTREMRERLDDMTEAAVEVERNPRIWNDSIGCGFAALGIFLAAIAILGVLYATGVIDYDFTKTAEERAATDVSEPGPPYMDGRHYAIYGIGADESRRVYTFELLGYGDSGAIRVWEDDTGKGTFTITDGTIVIEMARMVPPESHEIWEPNTFTGSISADGDTITGDWSREGWMGAPGEVELNGEWETIGFEAQRL